MKFLGTALIALVSLGFLVNAQQMTIANLTTCGLQCLIENIPRAGCTIADAACQCSSVTLPQLTTECLLSNCTMHDSLIVSKVTQSVCNLPHEDRAPTVIIVTAIAVVITSIFITLRVVSKAWEGGRLEMEDWFITAALLISFPEVYFTISMCKGGFGKHVFNLNDGDLAHILQQFFISENIYVVGLSITKISILALYLRIFPYQKFRYAAWATIGLIIVSTMVISFMTIFPCKPIAYFWDKDLKGSCININALAYANSAMSIVQDLIIVVLPVPVLTKLNMDVKRKIGVGCMFAIGSFGCVVSMVRLKSLLAFGNSIDPTWDYVDAVFWTTLELAIAMICACLPAIRNLLIRIFPSAFLSTLRSRTRTSQAVPAGSRASSGWGMGSKSSTDPSDASRSTGQFVELEERSDIELGLPMETNLALPPKISASTIVTITGGHVSDEEWLDPQKRHKLRRGV